MGDRLHPLRRKITAPSETRIPDPGSRHRRGDPGRHHQQLAAGTDGRGPAGDLLRAIAIDGEMAARRRGPAGQAVLFAVMVQEGKVVIAQRRMPDATIETTQIKALLDDVDVRNAVVTADAVNAQRGDRAVHRRPGEEGGRELDYFLFVKGNHPSLQLALVWTARPAPESAARGLLPL
jgi:hypothetical protein